MEFGGKSLADYAIVEELARSSTGVVYKARHKSTGRIVVCADGRKRT
jgi:hypothetical protein